VLLMIESWNSRVSIASRLRSGSPRHHHSIPGKS